MSLNITFDGFCSRSNGSLSSSDVQYQGFFYKVNSGSSTSKWNNVRTVEATGYWNINLGDGDWLTQTGNASAGDIIIIVFWRTGSNRNANCTILDEWGAFEVIMTSAETYTNPTQIKINIDPNLSWTFPNAGLVNTNYSSTNNSNDVHSWNWSGTTMYHWYQRHGQTINNVNQVNNSDYYWGDTTSDLDLPGSAIGTHQWSSAGIYDIDLVIEDECGATVTGTDQIQIYWHAPTADIVMIPAIPDPNEPVSFKWNGNDVDSRITSIDWTINDSGVYGNTNTTTNGQASGATVPHSAGTGTDWCGESPVAGAFTNPGVHNVSIVIHWNDGFTDHTLPYNENFTQNRFSGPIVSFTQYPTQATVSSGVEFTNTSSGTSRVGLGLSACDKYDWRWTDDGVNTDYLDKPYSYKLSQTPGSTDCQVRLCANWSDGWDTQQTCITENVVFGTKVTITEVDCYYNLNVVGTSTGGTITDYSWTIASGTSEFGPWTEIWNTPTGIEQNDKKICFTGVGWYKATGYIYGAGSPTNDDEVLYITEVCPPTTSGVEVIPICEPDMYGTEYGKLGMEGQEIKPSMKAQVDIIPSARIINTYPLPRNL